MRNQPLLQGLWLRDWFAHAPDDSTSASKISDQQSPIRNLEHRFSNILINRERVVASKTSIKDIFRTMFQIADRRMLIAEPEAPRVLRLFLMWVR
jgi:hypothetical protein